MTKILILHGPNLNLLGTREPEIYGTLTLAEINRKLEETAKAHGTKVYSIQSNIEGTLVDALQEAATKADGIIFNPAGYAHTSVALRDTVAAIGIPVVEVHLSNVYAREEFRHKSLLSVVCIGKISGFGWMSYKLALEALVEIIGRG